MRPPLLCSSPSSPQERDDNLVTYAATQEDFASDAKHFVQLTENNSMMIVDDAVRDNADFHFGAGLSPRIVRKLRGRACAFCRERAGTFDYSVDMNKEVFRRHPNCHCTVEYNPGNGSRKRQNVHSKEWRNATGTERLRDFAEGKAEQLRAMAREKAEIERRKHIGEKPWRGEDVTAEYFGTATPDAGQVVKENGFKEGAKKREVPVASYLHDTFGGNIVLKSKDEKNPCADFLWNEKLWELKTPDLPISSGAIKQNVRTALHQTMENPGGIILELLDEQYPIEEAIAAAEYRIGRSARNSIDLMILRKGKAEIVLRYKK